jgi:hypothetical protein
MFRFQAEAEVSPPLPLVDAEEVRKTAMTWQQKQDFGTAAVSDIQIHHKYRLHTACEAPHSFFFFPKRLHVPARH